MARLVKGRNGLSKPFDVALLRKVRVSIAQRRTHAREAQVTGIEIDDFWNDSFGEIEKYRGLLSIQLAAFLCAPDPPCTCA